MKHNMTKTQSYTTLKGRTYPLLMALAAFHEAGHAVMIYDCGGVVESIYIKPSKHIEGFETPFNGKTHARVLDRLRPYTVSTRAGVLAAGRIASQMLIRKLHLRWDEMVYANSSRDIDAFVKDLGLTLKDWRKVEKTFTFFNKVIRKTFEQRPLLWDKIERLADAILHAYPKRLSTRAIQQILSAKTS
jgi:hypothetical protein